jgi:DNA-directed RNA polymerase sigma subunit (sigma70/sigma32)
MTRDTLIEQNIDLVHSVVRGYLRQHPHLGYLKDDLLSAGQIGLCEAVDLIETSKPENAKGFLTIAIRRAIKEAVVNEDSIKVPTRTRSRLREQGREVEVVNRVHQLDMIARTDPGLELVDVMDAIDAACDSSSSASRVTRTERLARSSNVMARLCAARSRLSTSVIRRSLRDSESISGH